MSRLLIASLFVLSSGSSLLFADVKLVHAPAYKAGDVIQTEVEMDIDQTLTIAGMEIETGVNNYIVSEEKVTAASAEKVTMNSKLTAMQMEMSLPGGVSLNFDSGTPDAEAPAGPLGKVVKFFKLFSQATWTTTLDADRNVTEVKYKENFLDDIPEMFKGEVSPEKVKKEANTNIARLPGKEIAVGEKWNRNEESSLGQGQVFYFSREFEYLGNEEHNGKEMAKIGITIKSVKYDVEAGGALPLDVKSSELKADGSTGTFWYDLAAKQIVDTKETLHITGDLVLVANGQELPSKLDLTMKISSKITRAE